MKQADRLRAAWVVIIGPDEWSKGVATLRDMRTQEQREVSLEQLPPRLAASVRGDAHR
jgi:histidyl-tRNA synthetase